MTFRPELGYFAVKSACEAPDFGGALPGLPGASESCGPPGVLPFPDFELGVLPFPDFELANPTDPWRGISCLAMFLLSADQWEDYPPSHVCIEG